MERAARSLSKLRTSTPLSAEDLARTAWPVAVGKNIARHSAAVSLVRETLVVEVEDAVWQRNLFGLRHHIVRALKGVIGEGIVGDVEFRVAIARRPPQTAAALLSTDDADRIGDPVLRLVYKQARKKATA